MDAVSFPSIQEVIAWFSNLHPSSLSTRTEPFLSHTAQEPNLCKAFQGHS